MHVEQQTTSDSSSSPADGSAAGAADFAIPILDPTALARCFEREGYVVVRDAVPRGLCEATKQAFLRDVWDDRRFFKRHESSAYERHVYTQAGFMKYPIMNLQDLSGRRLRAFRQCALALVTHPYVQQITAAILGEPGKIVHTMYFDGNQRTWAHRDSHYIDSEQTGRMIGVWVAVEDIHPGAGRFFVHPRSHRAACPVELDESDPNAPEYKQKIAEFASDFQRVAPGLRQGDLIVWSSLTIHGSLETTAPTHSRRSVTAHYIPASHQYLWMRSRRGSTATTRFNGVEIVSHEEQLRPAVQLEHRLRHDFPRLHRAYARLRVTARRARQGARERWPALHRLYRAYKR